MTDHGDARNRTDSVGRGNFVLVFLISSAVLAFEVSLMRLLLVSGWHHFAFLVISVALLGFGTSGVFLYLFRRRILLRDRQWLFGLALAAAISMPICAGLLQFVPIESRFIPSMLMRQIGWWLLYWFILLIPFLLGAAAIGLALMMSGNRISSMYASNLAGSAAGSVLVNVLLWLLPTALLAVATGILALAASVFAPGISARGKSTVISAAIMLAALVHAFIPFEIRSDEYKYHSFVKQLANQNQARLITEKRGPNGVVSVYHSDMFHDLAFLSGAETPPPMHSILLDGHLAASVLDAGTLEESSVVRQVLSAAAHELLPARPSVLLPGELGGSNIWLAAWHQASVIDVVHHYPQVTSILRNELQDRGGAVLDVPAVTYHNAYPRHFIENTRSKYDLIQLTALESLPAGSGGMAGMGQNHLMTVEGIATALRRLSPEGLLVISRGIQDPPRDNLKIMALLAEALRHNGIEDVSQHFVIVRDFLAMCSIVKATPWSDEQLRGVEDMVERRHLTGVWWKGIPERYLNQPDHLVGPPDHHADWYHLAATKLFFDDADSFVENWMFDIRPPTDDRPFFHDFSKLGSIRMLQDVFGDLWLTRAEIGFLFVIAAMIGVGFVALVLTLVPLLFVRPGCGARTLLPTAGYFSCLGLAYLMLEITLLSKLTHLIGSPVVSAAVTIAAFLFFSGLGSLTAQRFHVSTALLGKLLLAIAVAAVVCMVALNPITRLAGGLSILPRVLVGVALVAPLAYLMGFPMPSGLSRLQHGPRQLVAWAWGINGFTSVLAAPAAMLIGMVWGFTPAALLAVALYLMAFPLFALIPEEIESGGKS